ncbi:MAG: phosphoglucomutase/phosphomannomutase family protein [Synechococcales cyanobacterium CRU_2_2]|nr:phosphoglucomutase/phosphomannomutase family protein [Synechococcales cyanobacterium CRU_2_2]
MAHVPPSFQPPGPIIFGTDGWRGIIAEDFTFERLYRAACAAARVLKEVYGESTGSNTVIIGYDRRFLSEEFAHTTATAARAVGLDVLMSESYAPTPAFSLAAKDRNALGALVITASHNPGTYSGLKIKGAFGGSVPPEVTQKVEALLAEGYLPQASTETAAPAVGFETFEPWAPYCEALGKKVDLGAIQAAVNGGQLQIFADVMYGAAATGLERILGVPVTELHGDRDPLFGGGAPEPLPRNLAVVMDRIQHRDNPSLAVGFVFDGDADRIAAIDETGEFCSSQVLIPILIEHLAVRRGLTGEVIKTVSGSDLMPKVAELFGLSVYETAVGYKYIADRMLTTPVLIGGEESGGIGYGSHIPERDGLLAALYVLEAIVQSGQGLAQLYRSLQERTNFVAAYDRIDLPLASLAVRDRVLEALQHNRPSEIAGQAVLDCITIDGYKFRLADQRWLMVRFSGTEPLLRLYCEAATLEQVNETLAWARDWAGQF